MSPVVMAPEDCVCGHPVDSHDAGECWWDLTANADSQDPRDQCPCDWYQPIGVLA